MKLKSSTYQFVVIIFSLLLFKAEPLLAQNFDSHEFKGKVYLDGNKAKDVLIKVFDGNKCFSEYITKSNGKFIFTAGCEKYYTLQFEKEGYITKRIAIKTLNTKGLDFVTKRYKFDVELVKKEPGIDYNKHEFPIAILELDRQSREFKFNKDYTENRLKEIASSSNNNLADN